MNTKLMILPAGGLPPARTLITIFVLSLFSGLDVLHIIYTYWIAGCTSGWTPENSFTKSQQIVFLTSGNIPPAKTNHFSEKADFRGRELEGAKMTNLSRLVCQRLKLMPILFFLHFKAVQL